MTPLTSTPRPVRMVLASCTVSEWHLLQAPPHPSPGDIASAPPVKGSDNRRKKTTALFIDIPLQLRVSSFGFQVSSCKIPSPKSRIPSPGPRYHIPHYSATIMPTALYFRSGQTATVF